MAVVGHPSREARKQPQHIVMRYICQALPPRLYRIAIYGIPPTNPRTAPYVYLFGEVGTAAWECTRFAEREILSRDSPLLNAATSRDPWRALHDIHTMDFHCTGNVRRRALADGSTKPRELALAGVCKL